MSNKQFFSAKANAKSTSETNTKPSAIVTSEASASATSTTSYNDAYQKAKFIAQNIANSTAKNDANIITESVNLTQRIIQSNYVSKAPTGSTGTFLLQESNGNIYNDPSILSFTYNSITGSNENRNIIVGGSLIPGDSFDPNGASGFKGPYSLGNPQNRWNGLWLEGGTIYLSTSSAGGNTTSSTYGSISYGNSVQYTPNGTIPAIPYPWNGTGAYFFDSLSYNISNTLIPGTGLIFGSTIPPKNSSLNGNFVNNNIYFYNPVGTTIPGVGKTGSIIPLINQGLLHDYASVNGNYSLPNYGLSSVGFNALSDHRIKEHVTTLDETFKVDYLNPVTYHNIKTNKQDIGLIAHELQEHYPELVNGEKDGENFQTVNYIGLVPILINEIKNIKNNIMKLEDRICQLEK